MTAFEPINVPHAAKLRACDFALLAQAGAFADYARSELIEGEIWVVNAVYSWHAKTMARLAQHFGNALDALGDGLTLYVPVAIAMSDDSVPEPDLSVGLDNADGFLPLEKLKLAVEVSDTTLDIDLGRKARLYARHGVPEYWVVDREGTRVVQMWRPEGDAYAQVVEIGFGGAVTAATIAGLTIPTDRLT
jgi:Uma2 family endonuclease